MLRNVSLEDISDGKLYTENDLVRVDTNSCKGCQTVCCQNMGSTIVLDPYDCYKLTTGLGKTFEQLTMNELELNVVDGIIMPNLKMQKSDGRCAFLREDNLCNIHTIRPGWEYAECSHLEDTGRMRRILNILCRRASVIRIIYRRLN